MKSVDVLGCRVDDVDAALATEQIIAAAQAGAAAQVVTLGTEMVVHAQKDERFRAIVNAAALSLCDTVGVLTVARKHGATIETRVTGVELVESVCAMAAVEGISVYFLGGSEGVASDAAAILEARHPGLLVAGTRNGFFSIEESPQITKAIRTSGAQVLFVGLGSPRQEFWLAEHLRETGAGAAIGVGGSFDVVSGRVRRAPYIWRRFGLEWLYRLMREPQRWRRQLALPHFVWLAFLDRMGMTSKKGIRVP